LVGICAAPLLDAGGTPGAGAGAVAGAGIELGVGMDASGVAARSSTLPPVPLSAGRWLPT